MSERVTPTDKGFDSWCFCCPLGHRSIRVRVTKDHYECTQCDAFYEGDPVDLRETDLEDVDPKDTFLHTSGATDGPWRDMAEFGEGDLLERAFKIAESRGGWMRSYNNRSLHVPAPDKSEYEVLCENQPKHDWKQKAMETFPDSWVEDLICGSCLKAMKGRNPKRPENRESCGNSPEKLLKELGFKE